MEIFNYGEGNLSVEEQDNIIYLKYEPVIADIKIRYLNENNENIINDKIIKT